MKSVLLLDTGIASQNVGDEIINDSIKKNWQELYSQNCIFRMPSHTPPYAWWQQLFFKRKINAFVNADIKFLCGTNALYTNMFRPVPQFNVHLWNYMMYKGTVLLGVGAGINSNGVNLYTKTLYNKLLTHDYIHSVRDDYTVSFLNKIGFNAVNTGCPTLWGFDEAFCRDIPHEKSDKVVFTLTGYQPDPTNDLAMIKVLKDNYSKLYFWPQTYEDLRYLKSLGDIKCDIVAPNLPAYDKILEWPIDYVGNRLHGGIRALQHKRRSIIIAIDYRAINMRKKNTLPVIDRSEIISSLKSMILRDFRTEISGIDFDLIQRWKSQF